MKPRLELALQHSLSIAIPQLHGRNGPLFQAQSTADDMRQVSKSWLHNSVFHKSTLAQNTGLREITKQALTAQAHLAGLGLSFPEYHSLALRYGHLNRSMTASTRLCDNSLGICTDLKSSHPLLARQNDGIHNGLGFPKH
jgi:hypothetical protein